MPEKQELKTDFHSPIELLKFTASEFHRLEAEATQALTVEKNASEAQSKVNEKAKLLVDLPSKMAKLIEENDAELDEEKITQLQHFADIAEERIREGDYFGLSTLLIHKGSEKGEPNALDKLIEEIADKYENKKRQSLKSNFTYSKARRLCKNGRRSSCTRRGYKSCTQA